MASWKLKPDLEKSNAEAPQEISQHTEVDTGKHKWIEAIERLTELTKKGEIKWDVVDANDAEGASSLDVYAAYDARYGERIVRFLETELPMSGMVNSVATTVNGPDLVGLGITPQMSRGASYKRRTAYSLLLIDRNGVPLFAFPRSDNLIELLAAIKYQLADIDAFLNTLLAAA